VLFAVVRDKTLFRNTIPLINVVFIFFVTKLFCTIFGMVIVNGFSNRRGSVSVQYLQMIARNRSPDNRVASDLFSPSPCRTVHTDCRLFAVTVICSFLFVGFFPLNPDESVLLSPRRVFLNRVSMYRLPNNRGRNTFPDTFSYRVFTYQTARMLLARYIIVRCSINALLLARGDSRETFITGNRTSAQ